MLTMKSNLYNPDGTLSVEAQSLLSPKPADMSTKERRHCLRTFKLTLSHEELEAFHALKEKERARRAYNKQKQSGKRREIDKQNYYRDPLKHIRRGTARAKVRYNTDPLYRMKQKLRWAVQDAFRRIKKSKPASTEKMLGCSYLEAKAHFESLFSASLNWLRRSTSSRIVGSV